MAVLTPDQLADVRQGVSASGVSITFDKPTVNAAVQALEDWFEATGRGLISTAINAATAPTTLTVAQKKAVVRFWLESKFERGG